MERAKHRVFGSLLWTIIIDAVDKHRHAQDVGQQDELVAPFAAELANGLQKLDSARPFRVGKARFLHRGMDMGDEYLHNLAQPRVCVRPDPCVDQIGRSEEHTSELQSLMRISYAVFCLKKKKNNHSTYSKDK